MPDIYVPDTNLLVYAADQSNLAKRDKSLRLLDWLSTSRFVLPMQCLTEFYAVTTRKGVLTSVEANDLVDDYLAAAEVVPASVEDLQEAMQMRLVHNFQFFDLLLLATARRAGATVLLTEDMQHGRLFNNVRITNPFLLSDAEFASLLAQS